MVLSLHTDFFIFIKVTQELLDVRQVVLTSLISSLKKLVHFIVL